MLIASLLIVNVPASVVMLYLLVTSVSPFLITTLEIVFSLDPATVLVPLIVTVTVSFVANDPASIV